MVAKKSTKKRSTRSTTPSTKKSTRSKKPAPMRSFKLSPDTPGFTTFRVTRQTVYWTILLIFIIIMQLWILKIQLDIATLTDQLLAQ